MYIYVHNTMYTFCHIYNIPACVLNNRLLVAVIIAKTANCYSIDIELFMNRRECVIDICDLSDIMGVYSNLL